MNYQNVYLLGFILTFMFLLSTTDNHFRDKTLLKEADETDVPQSIVDMFESVDMYALFGEFTACLFTVIRTHNLRAQRGYLHFNLRKKDKVMVFHVHTMGSISFLVEQNVSYQELFQGSTLYCSRPKLSHFEISKIHEITLCA